MANEFKFKAKKAEILNELYDNLDSKLRDETKRYTNVGLEDEQAKDWRTGELMWDDEEHTVPHYNPKYEYIDVPEDEMSEDQKARIKAIHDIQNNLIKLL